MLLPLIPSVHPSAQRAEGTLGLRQEPCIKALARDRHVCRFCALPAGSWQDVFTINDDHADTSADNLAAACPLCHGVQHIADAHADEQMRVIWLPEISQNLLNVVVRGIHEILHGEGLPCTLAKRPIFNTPAVSAAWRAYLALDRRASTARSVIDSDRPRDLAAALSALTPDQYGRRASLIGGLRLLHRGRHFQDGRDVYAEQLDAWFAKPAAGTPQPPNVKE
ncbi:MAG: HNH endonuclease [Alphaproteobacteria bacterium]|nr:MAG: HNH endonuclease [Alphaproteobacteria bacterium]